jgi:apolipoprotein N-acyltransferase
MQKLSALLGKFPRWTALVAGAASAYGFEPWGLWPLTFVCFALLIQLISQAPNTKGAFMLGWLFGVGHFTFGNQWIAVAFTFQAAMPIWLGYIAVFGLALYLAVYPALAAAGAYWINHRTINALRQTAESEDDAKPRSTPTLQLILAFAGLWIITEWLRSWVFTGYVWNPLSVVMVSMPPLAEAATSIGTYGLSGLLCLTAGAMAYFWGYWLRAICDHWKDGSWLTYFMGGLLLFAFGCAVLFSKFAPFGQESNYGPPDDGPTLITIAQPNISQADKYAPGYGAINFAKLAMNSRPMPNQGARLILWPEAAIPDYLEEGYPYRYYQGQPGESAFGARARLTTLMGDGDVLVTGANRLVIEKGQLVAARNSVSAMDANGNILGHYDKAHLVPYGEYLPLPWLLRPLGLARLVPGDLDFWPGPGPQTMTVMLNGKPVKIGMQICYEMIFSGQVTDRKNRPDFIFNPSNDAWFGTIGPPQHLAQARLRAIEEGLPVVRATPTGISAVIDANGRIIKSLPLGTSGRIDAVVPQAKAPTLFARFGNILPLGFAALLIACALLPLARRAPSR